MHSARRERFCASAVGIFSIAALCHFAASRAVAQPAGHAAEVDTALDRPLGTVRFAATPLDRALRELSDLAALDLMVHWDALYAAGVDRDRPVTLDARATTARRVLEYLVRELSVGREPIEYALIDGTIEVSSAADFAARPITRAYDCRDLLRDAPPAAARQDDRDVSVHFRPWPSGAAAWEPRGFSMSRHSLRVRRDDPSLARQREIIRAIAGTVAPASWIEAGGTVGELAFVGDRLVVRQTRPNQMRIAALLAELRGGAAVAVPSKP